MTTMLHSTAGFSGRVSSNCHTSTNEELPKYFHHRAHSDGAAMNIGMASRDSPASPMVMNIFPELMFRAKSSGQDVDADTSALHLQRRRIARTCPYDLLASEPSPEESPIGRAPSVQDSTPSTSPEPALEPPPDCFRTPRKSKVFGENDLWLPVCGLASSADGVNIEHPLNPIARWVKDNSLEMCKMPKTDALPLRLPFSSTDAWQSCEHEHYLISAPSPKHVVCLDSLITPNLDEGSLDPLHASANSAYQCFDDASQLGEYFRRGQDDWIPDFNSFGASMHSEQIIGGLGKLFDPVISWAKVENCDMFDLQHMEAAPPCTPSESINIWQDSENDKCAIHAPSPKRTFCLDAIMTPHSDNQPMHSFDVMVDDSDTFCNDTNRFSEATEQNDIGRPDMAGFCAISRGSCAKFLLDVEPGFDPILKKVQGNGLHMLDTPSMQDTQCLPLSISPSSLDVCSACESDDCLNHASSSSHHVVLLDAKVSISEHDQLLHGNTFEPALEPSPDWIRSGKAAMAPFGMPATSIADEIVGILEHAINPMIRWAKANNVSILEMKNMEESQVSAGSGNGNVSDACQNECFAHALSLQHESCLDLIIAEADRVHDESLHTLPESFDYGEQCRHEVLQFNGAFRQKHEQDWMSDPSLMEANTSSLVQKAEQAFDPIISWAWGEGCDA